MKVLKWTAALLFAWLSVIPAVLHYERGIFITPLLFVIPMFSMQTNYLGANDYRSLIALSVNSALATLCTFGLQFGLYYTNISADDGTYTLGVMITTIATAFIAQYAGVFVVIRYWADRLLKQYTKADA